MALITCKECGTKVSDKAEKCQQCGAPVPKGVGAGAVIKWIIVAFFGYVIYSCTTALEKADRDSDARSASTPAATSAPPAPPAPPLKILSWRCEKERKYTHVKGEVKNVSDQPLQNVLAVGTLRSKSGEMIETDEALLDLRTLMPGQKSTFEVMISDNPLGTNCNLAFRTIRGEPVATTDP